MVPGSSAAQPSGMGEAYAARQLEWYLRRMRRMSPSEIAWRLRLQTRKWAWASYHPVWDSSRCRLAGALLSARETSPRLLPERQFTAVLPREAIDRVPPGARRATVEAADGILDGRWEVLGVERTDMEYPDWLFDPVTKKRAPGTQFCFKIDHRREEVTGNIKQIWELSRFHHVTVLAAAFAFTGDARYAERAGAHLRSWWSQNQRLSGIHWTSGIEAGIRLISWVWTRRLLEGWPLAADLFEHNLDALEQIWWHQRYLSTFRSRGSSANNHVIAEMAGQLVAALAFAWFEDSVGWAAEARDVLQAELTRNTFPSGVNREMAFDYHGFVAELGLVAAAEADLAGHPLDDSTWNLLGKMIEVVAAIADEELRPPRYGDGDDGRALVLDATSDRWASLLRAGGEILGAGDWWPEVREDALSGFLASMSTGHPRKDRRPRRPSHFGDAGLVVLRSSSQGKPEIWCRCDSGPHGFLSIAAHAHADALGLEVRHGGVDIFADPGTYCYHGEREWRSYFRSTLAHNTIELGGTSQSGSGGPFLWARHSQSRLLRLVHNDLGEPTAWSAENDGYGSLDPPAVHRRTVELFGQERRLEIVDELETAGGHQFRLLFHLGPEIRASLRDGRAHLSWASRSGVVSTATVSLPTAATWRLARGETAPVLGWYSERFGTKVPATTVLGEGRCHGLLVLRSVLQFHDDGASPVGYP